MAVSRFRGAIRPNAEVVSLLETALESARNGHVRTILIVTVNPLHEVEQQMAGDLSATRRTVLIGGLSRAVNALIAED
jgi:hypothetical protein